MSTAAKARIIPTESDALKGPSPLFVAVVFSANDKSRPSKCHIYIHITHRNHPPSLRHPSSPFKISTSSTTPSTPTRRRIFAYHSPSEPASNPGTHSPARHSNGRGLFYESRPSTISSLARKPMKTITKRL